MPFSSPTSIPAFNAKSTGKLRGGHSASGKAISLSREGQLQPDCQRRRPRPLKSGSHLDPPVLINIMLLGLIASSMDDTMHNACSSVWLAKIHRQLATPVLALPCTAKHSSGLSSARCRHVPVLWRELCSPHAIVALLGFRCLRYLLNMGTGFFSPWPSPISADSYE
ncbi:hypothetical protein V2G26_008654 [Clonostachys chloroleuca]